MQDRCVAQARAARAGVMVKVVVPGAHFTSGSAFTRRVSARDPRLLLEQDRGATPGRSCFAPAVRESLHADAAAA